MSNPVPDAPSPIDPTPHDRAGPSGRTLVRGAGLLDARLGGVSPACVLVEGEVVLAAGAPEAIGDVAGAHVVNASDRLLLPPLVNAHTHLDLTDHRRAPYGGSFLQWVGGIRRHRAEQAERGAGAIASAVHEGVRRSLAGGVTRVGDIGGSDAAVDATCASGIGGVAFVELFGFGARADEACARIDAQRTRGPAVGRRALVGVQPHAPYSCALRTYRHAAASGLPVATHLAETLEEVEFVRERTGPFAALLESIGVDLDDVDTGGPHPARVVAPVLDGSHALLVHLNHLDDPSISAIAATDAIAVFCPRASTYFGHRVPGDPAFAPHPWRALHSRGVPIALGTDGASCLDRDDRLSTLDEVGLLVREEGVEPREAIAMATIAAAPALRFDPDACTFAPGAKDGLGSVPWRGDVRRSIADPGDFAWVVGPFGAVDR